MNDRKKLFVIGAMVVLTAFVAAQHIDTTPRIRSLPMSSTSNIVYSDPDTTSLTFALTDTALDTFYVAFPFDYQSYFEGLVNLTVTLTDTISLRVYGFPCVSTTLSPTSVTMTRLFLHQSDYSLDSLLMVSDTKYPAGTHRLEWGIRAGLDPYAWGPAHGMMVVFRQRYNVAEPATSLVFRAWGQ